ncbi:MAG: ABC transporter ATP-binding protein [Gammaproteobacteria bacterium]|nr:ABC transporter ATP-binding protein [Gammaproteobacteria bacterium]
MASSSVNNDDPVIQASGIVKRFGGFVAVDHVDITLQRGEVFGLLGANGAGKTTAIRMLCGTLPPSEGTINVAGIDMVRHARRARSRLGYVSQRFALYAELSVLENLKLQAGLYGLSGKHKRDRLRWALQHLEMAQLQHQPAGKLPLGYQRRLALAAALMHQPQVLFLDEPTSGVDPMARQQFWELIYELAEQGIGVLVTTHYMDEALFCDRIAFMHTGKIIAQDTPQKLKAMPLTTPLLQLDSKDCARCAQLISALDSIKEIVPHAGQLRIRLQPGVDMDSAEQQIKSVAKQSSLQIGELRPVDADLEDVFVAVLEDFETRENA